MYERQVAKSFGSWHVNNLKGLKLMQRVFTYVTKHTGQPNQVDILPTMERASCH